MRGKEDGTKGPQIKWLPASSVGPFIGRAALTQAFCILSLTHEYSRTQGGWPRTKPRGRGCHRETRSSTTCCGQSGRRLCPGPREAQSWPGLLNHQAVSPAHTRWLLCVSEQWRKCPAGLAGSNSPSALSISSQGHLAKLPQCCLERTGNDRACYKQWLSRQRFFHPEGATSETL